jgi:hypothetical protein
MHSLTELRTMSRALMMRRVNDGQEDSRRTILLEKLVFKESKELQELRRSVEEKSPQEPQTITFIRSSAPRLQKATQSQGFEGSSFLTIKII